MRACRDTGCRDLICVSLQGFCVRMNRLVARGRLPGIFLSAQMSLELNFANAPRRLGEKPSQELIEALVSASSLAGGDGGSFGKRRMVIAVLL